MSKQQPYQNPYLDNVLSYFPQCPPDPLKALYFAEEAVANAQAEVEKTFALLYHTIHEAGCSRQEWANSSSDRISYDDFIGVILQRLYWDDYTEWGVEIPIQWIAEAFELTEDQVREGSGSVPVTVWCPRCDTLWELDPKSRERWKELTKDQEHYAEVICEACAARPIVEKSTPKIEYLNQKKNQRQQALQTMPYQEYLQTPEWQARRDIVLRFAQYRCQICNTYNRVLHVHHRTYERRGREALTDLVVLCDECHALYHGKFSQEGR